MASTIAILTAGHPDLRKTGHEAKKALSNFSYNIVEIDVDENIAQNLKTAKPDLVFIALHGPHYTDGRIQGLLETLGIKYTHSGVLASAVAANKVLCKNLFQSFGIDTPAGYVITRKDILENNIKMKYPYVLKPISEAYSLGLHIIFSHNDYLKLKSDPSDIRDKMIIEEYVPGVDLLTPVLLDEPVGTIEIRLKHRIFNYDAKTKKGLVEKVFPAEIPDNVYKMTLDLALKAHRLLGCKTVSRSDFRYNPENGALKMLEINTHPALFESTPFQKAVASVKGIDTNDLFHIIVKDSL